MSEFTTIARPYAKAAFDFAVEHNAIEKWTTMLNFGAELVKQPELENILSGSSSALKISDTIISICGEQFDQYGQNFIRVIAENKRLNALPAIFQQFLNYVAEYQATAEVDVISAQPLNDEQRKKIAQAMEKKLARKVKLNCSVDSTLIAGAIIRADDMVIDGSSRGQLTRLANELQL
ncbi:F0F1 ATP synthase subunit delta [Conservatibacter flavescens]|uniref:ATP synthase subunit delta n=1 Tax=Conservatibacter flavescens TaxID=28161 RepID=A0A2M8S4P8_9PAST|nr:F0F1 ATP synthase subunit delta [Conservatibacter flavescens]PJG86058.1 F0F1 ATP synthase subunit delta [Conservatibacter flavescens]